VLFDRYKKLSRLKKNVLSGSISAGGSFFLLLVAYPIYLKYLGAELYGLWAAISIVVFFSGLGNLGINNALIKYVAEKFGQEDFRGITNYTSTSFYILVVPSILILFLLFFFNEWIVALLGLKDEYLEQALRLIPLIGVLSIFTLFVELVKGVLMGVGRIDIANYVFFFGRLIQVIVSVILIISGLGIWGLYYGTAACYIMILVIYLYYLHYHFDVRIFRIDGFRKGYMKNLLAFGGTMFSARIVSMLVEPFNKVVISRYIGLSEVTYYDIAVKGAVNLRSLFEMGLKAIMPRISELQQKVQDFKKDIGDIYKKSLKFILFFALPVFCGLFLLSKVVLSLWLGSNYNPQISMALRWFLFSYIINLFAVPSYYTFMGIGKVRYCFLDHLITTVANILIILILISLNTISFQLLIITHAFSVFLSAIVMISLFTRFKNTDFERL
jgi:O-antigen/teichoic acid export membrane protein